MKKKCPNCGEYTYSEKHSFPEKCWYCGESLEDVVARDTGDYNVSGFFESEFIKGE